MFSSSRLILYALTIAYTILGAYNAIHQKNGEFLAYAIGFILLLAVVYYVLYKLRLPLYLSWMLAILGALHLAGGTFIINGDVLYNYVIIPLQNPTGLTIWKFDQLVHPYGAFVATFIAAAALRKWTSIPMLAIVVVAFFAANGVGALNEVIEFIAKLTIADTDVGGYYNTALDLFFNMLGAFIASVSLLFLPPERLARHSVSG